MSDQGIRKLTEIIEFIKKKKIDRAVVEYQTYSKMPSKKSRDYINGLEERVLKGEVDLGNISESEIKLFNEKPSEEDVLKRKGEVKRNIIIAGGVGIIVCVMWFAGAFETTLRCDICDREVQPNQTVYSRTASTEKAGELASYGGVIYCSPSCLAKYAY